MVGVGVDDVIDSGDIHVVGDAGTTSEAGGRTSEKRPE